MVRRRRVVIRRRRVVIRRGRVIRRVVVRRGRRIVIRRGCGRVVRRRRVVARRRVRGGRRVGCGRMRRRRRRSGSVIFVARAAGQRADQQAKNDCKSRGSFHLEISLFFVIPVRDLRI